MNHEETKMEALYEDAIQRHAYVLRDYKEVAAENVALRKEIRDLKDQAPQSVVQEMREEIERLRYLCRPEAERNSDAPSVRPEQMQYGKSYRVTLEGVMGTVFLSEAKRLDRHDLQFATRIEEIS